MTLYHNSKQKIRNIKRTIEALLDGAFPLGAGKRALERLNRAYDALEKQLDRAHALKDPILERQQAQNVTLKVFETLPILGFISRSMSVKNAFEFVDPLQMLAKNLLQGSAQLMLSSEWEYIPFAYPQSLDDLASFVLIGTPASESGSALLIPLAGHELGHAVWRNQQLSGSVSTTLQIKCEELYSDVGKLDEFRRLNPDYKADDILAKEILTDAIAISVDCAVAQAEEIFCDMIAYAIFGESYVHAFAYILAPGSTTRDSKYPSYKTRIETITNIALAEGAAMPDYGALGFSEPREIGDAKTRFILRMSESAARSITNGLWQKILELIKIGSIDRPNVELSRLHLAAFRLGIPGSEPRCLGDIINAGWSYYKEIQIAGNSDKTLGERIDSLNEMILKTVEILEYRRRVGNGT